MYQLLTFVLGSPCTTFSCRWRLHWYKLGSFFFLLFPFEPNKFAFRWFIYMFKNKTNKFGPFCHVTCRWNYCQQIFVFSIGSLSSLLSSKLSPVFVVCVSTFCFAIAGQNTLSLLWHPIRHFACGADQLFSKWSAKACVLYLILKFYSSGLGFSTKEWWPWVKFRSKDHMVRFKKILVMLDFNQDVNDYLHSKRRHIDNLSQAIFARVSLSIWCMENT